jgi:uncharacterized DUF497 family protein
VDNRLRFQWDRRKAAANLRKHDVSSEEAATTFDDDFAQEFDDSDHSQTEDRFILLGFSKKLRTLVTSFCYRANEEIIRIISARKADKDETIDYFKGRSK